MSMTALARSSLRSSVSLARYGSSQASPNLSLPPEKLRALISIYHQAEHFITPQNLSSAIDRAFLGVEMTQTKTLPITEACYEEVKAKLRRRRSSPRMGAWDENETLHKQPDYLSQGWSESNSGRERMVMAALYGDDGTGKPGLEMLEDERERLDSYEADDKARESG